MLHFIKDFLFLSLTAFSSSNCLWSALSRNICFST